MININQIAALIKEDQHTKLVRKLMPPDYSENQSLIVLFSILLQNSKNRILFHPSMILPLLKPEFIDMVHEDIFKDLSPLKLFLQSQLMEDSKSNLAEGETIDEPDIVKKVDLLIKNSNQHIKKLISQCHEEKESNFSMELFPVNKKLLPPSINFVWIKLANTQFPSLSTDKSFVTNGTATFEELLPAENLAVLIDWVSTYGNNAVTVWLDSRLLETSEYDALVLGLSTHGINSRDISKAFPEDIELKKIPEIVDYFSKHSSAANLGYIIDLIKFKALFHFVKEHQEDDFVYIHSDFDYNPISKVYLKKELGFQTHWGAGKTIENDFFICDHWVLKQHPGLIGIMGVKHQEIIQQNLFKNHSTNDLFRYAYHAPIMLRYKTLSTEEREHFKVEHSALEKHSQTKHHYRTWNSP